MYVCRYLVVLPCCFFVPKKASWDTLQLFSKEWIRKQHKISLVFYVSNASPLRQMPRRCVKYQPGRLLLWPRDVANVPRSVISVWKSFRSNGVTMDEVQAYSVEIRCWWLKRTSTPLKNLMHLVLQINSYAFSSIICAYSNVLSESKRRSLS